MAVERVPRETDTAIEALFGTRRKLAERYEDLLVSSGVERGLIGPREAPRIWERHILNCAAVAQLIESDIELVDVGSGAGLPGVVLAIARPDLSVTLVEPLLRRVTWLETLVTELSLENVEVLRERAEGVAASGRQFDVSTARAVAPLSTLAGWCLPLLRPEGVLLAIKGRSAAEELKTAGDVLSRLGATSWSVTTCGEGVLEPPTIVVRVVAGSVSAERRSRRSARRAGGRSSQRRGRSPDA